MVDAPCSRIGHIYRKFAPFPNPGVGDFVGRVSIYHQNNIRICSQSNKLLWYGFLWYERVQQFYFYAEE